MDMWFFGHYDPKETGEILSKFSRYRMEAGFPKDVALFKRIGNKHESETLYFSPSSHEVAKMFDAKPCSNPHKEKLSLWCGDDKVW